ncbi:calcium uniporter protein 4, mitochondrial-like [Euphorbia lathyris]|uniref:calcium uniporter protein 4, mitochondrial-like n=1 Tax=Euphorbia lathyris TaxID=212925 RepID=UPI00331444E0
MALRKLFSKHLSGSYTAVSLQHSPISSPASLKPTVPPNAAKSNFHKEYLNPPESSQRGFFRRFLHRRSINQLPKFLSMPIREKLNERLKSITGDGICFDGLALSPPAKESEATDLNCFRISVEEARKILRLSQMEKLKLKLRQIGETSIQYHEFVQICVEECGNEIEGVEFAKTLDQCGNVIVLGSIVFLRPEQVAKSIQNIITQSIVCPDNSKREQLKEMELQKAMIDKKARAQVRVELYCGLGFLMVQTLGFMRLTFWELSWDVMEPICYFVTSIHFGLAYMFFLRTCIEPSFEGYFQRRLKTKQKKLMEIHNFDLRKYNKLRKAFYPDQDYNYPYSHFYKPGNGV